MSARELGLLCLICVIWGMHFVVLKLTVDAIPPMFYAALRMMLVTVIMSPFLRWRSGEMGFVLVGALCLGIFNYACLFTGLSLTTASSAAMALELNVPFATLLAAVFLGDRPRWKRLLGIALAFAGVAVIALGGSSQGGEEVQIGLGVGLVAGAAFLESLGAVVVKRTTSFRPHELIAWFAFAGSIGLTALSAIFETGQLAVFEAPVPLSIVGAILYSALGATLLGHTSYYWLLQRLPISVVAPSILFTTIIAVFGGVVILGDPFGPRMVIGGLMTLAGVGLVLLRNVKKQANNGALIEPQG